VRFYCAGVGLVAGDAVPAKDGRVLVERDWRAAELRASLHRADVYEVEITGSMFADDGVTCEAAQVLRVVKRCVPPRIAVKAIRAQRNAEARRRRTWSLHANQAGESKEVPEGLETDPGTGADQSPEQV